MLLNNLRSVLTGTSINLRIIEGQIAQVSPDSFAGTSGQFKLTFENAFIFPGLVNSHDHLDFNLFPALGNKKYNSYTEWGRHIHKNHKQQINQVLKVPEELRLLWGIYKNLLCGVTTVVNHGKKIKKQNWPITIYQQTHDIHSVQFGKRWRLSLNNPLKKKLPVVIHTGEGKDLPAKKEVDRLIHWNLLKRNIIGVHGVSLTEQPAKKFRALVWCPESNYFLLDQTAAVNRLKEHTTLLFGTDSTLTGSWNIWDHIRLARKTKLLYERELYDTLTLNAAATWNLNGGELAEGRDADLVVAKMKKNDPSDAFFDLNPEDILLVIHKGRISLFDEELYPQLKNIDLDSYSRVYADGTCKYVRGNLPLLMQKIKEYYPGAVFPVL